MPQFSIAGFLTFFTTFSLAIFVFFYNRKSIVNKIFCIYSLSISEWSFFTALHALTNSQSVSFSSARIMHLGVPLIPVLFYHFCLVLLNSYNKYKRNLFIGYIISGVLIIANFTSSLIVPRVIPKLGYHYFMDGGFLYPFLIISFSIYAIMGLYLLLKAYLSSIGNKRNQLKYLFWGTLLGYAFGASCFLPVYDITILPYPFGSYAIAVYVGITAYAILRHQLMDIEVLIKKTLVFASLFTIVFGVFVGITLLTQELIAGGRLLGFAISSLVIIFMVRPLEDILVRITDKYLFQKEYDRQQLLKELSQGIVGKIELEKLKSFIYSALSEKMKLENIAIIDDDNILFSWHKENRIPILYDAIDYLTKGKKDDVVGVKTRMRELRASLSVPIFFKDELFWLLLLGNKKSGRIYSNEDINMLDALSHEVSIAIENAINFQELKRSQVELLRQENLKFVSVLVKGLAHEIFNPLTPLMHKIEDLEGEDLLNIYDIYEKNKSKFDKDDELKFKESLLSLRESTRSLKNNANHIHLIVDTLNKLEKGDEKTIGPVDIKSFFKEIVTLFGLEVDPNLRQGIVVSQNIERNLPPVKANPTLLKQIFINLYKNSCYAMKNSTSKTIDILGKFNEQKKDEILIEFSDTGAGIPAEILPKIFTHGFTTKGAKGSGIGLNQCKAMIERFGGSINVESEKGKGTKFVIRFPIWKEEAKDAR